jgi:hydroxymethylbilane synthase
VLATRRSDLAVAQTGLVADRIRALGHDVELLPLTTTGDRWSASGDSAPPDKGMFVKELERALLDGDAHLAVHSAKDIPAEMPEGLGLVGVPPRADARDVVIGAPGGLLALPPGARVATGSPRRAAQIEEARPDLEIVDIRGNVPTRLKRLEDGLADALVIAAAGLERLGLGVARAPLPVELSTPAPGQGYLALQGRRGDLEVAGLASNLTEDADRLCLDAERAVLVAVGGGCQSAVGAYCSALAGGRYSLTVYVRPEGATIGTRAAVEGDDARTLAAEAVAALDDPES